MDEIRQIPLTALHESPFNPRKTYPEHELQELAESVKAQGIMQPIVARVQPEELNKDGHFDYEVIFGHRRLRAAWLAGLDSAPVIVRTMTDEQAAIAQVHENMKRQDVTALEEADGYVHLRDAHGMTTERIAQEVGKTKSYVYARLKLASAATEVRQAVSTRGLSPEIALLIARLPHVVLQRAALTRVRLPDFRQLEGEPEQWASVRDTKRILKELFELDVDVAQFDTKDEKLIESAGACTSCPKRAGNMEGLSEILDPGICTDSDCYKQKQEAFVWLRTDQLRAEGRTVIEGDAAADEMTSPHSLENHSRLDSTTYDPESNSYVPLATLLKRPGAPKIVPAVIVSPYDGRLIDIVTDEQAEELQEFARSAKSPRSPGAPARDAGHQAQQDEREAAIAALSPAQRACLDPGVMVQVRRAVLMAMVETSRSIDELRHMLAREMQYGDSDLGMVGEILGLRVLAKAAEDEQGDEFSAGEWYENWAMTTATASQLGAALAMLAIEHSLEVSWHDRGPEAANRRMAIVNAYGIDPADFLPESEREPVEDPASTPSLAARAQEAAEVQEAQDGDASADAAVESQSTPPAKKTKPAKKAAPAKAAAKVKKAAKVKIAKEDAGSADEDQKDEPADAGVARDPNTADMFHG